MIEQIEPLQPGIYLGLDEEIYFDDPAVSFSGIKKLLRSPAEYWLASKMNPNRDPKAAEEKDVLSQGKLFHTLLLEPGRFDEKYFIMPGGRWDEQKKMVSRSDYQATVGAVKVVRSLERAERLFDKSFGYPEVTVVWLDPRTGVMCRARHDFFCWEWTVDYKTADNIQEDFLRMTFRRYEYHLQHAHYTEGRKQVRKMMEAGKANFYGEFSDKFMNEFMGAQDDFFTFVFQGKKDPYTALPIMLDESSIENGQNQCRKGLDIFKRYMDQYGTDKPWPSAPKGVRTFSIYHGFDQTEDL